MEYLGYFLLGLGLNLTPCVYPMITITLSLFRGSEAHTSWRAFGRAVLYVLGIAVMFTSVGIFAAFTGDFFGGLLQNSWVLLAIGLFIIALSLSMFGLYTFRPPSWLVPQHRVSHVNLFSYFLSGLFVGIVAAPCMGPVVLALLTHVSQERNIVFGAGSFLMLALGLGSPYLVLGTFSGLLKKLPKSGAWLVWFERLLAVALFSFGCFYLIIAFRWPIVPWIVPIAFTLGGIYLGWFERSAHASKKFLVFKRVAGVLITAAGVMMMTGIVSFRSPAGLVWEDYRPGILEEAAASEQPVVLDFYADWCIPCHELEQFTYSDPGVIETLGRFRKIKVDATSADSAETLDAIRRFGVFGVPTIVFLDEKGREVKTLRMNGYVSPSQFVRAIRGSILKKYAEGP
ncbi:MAG TPA: cytochrome c biogenesis protein CcdA [Candidatus Omnitrophota bacterium]|nr:cytochrome c biogenesis protein CcdA [Candidatus Omnitrophota bacterium]HRY84899.1 cytochrome c biogenesis protein CcdA [Candidatus Omnitrophota bacterium]